jgi:hypothetical protein
VIIGGIAARESGGVFQQVQYFARTEAFFGNRTGILGINELAPVVEVSLAFVVNKVLSLLRWSAISSLSPVLSILHRTPVAWQGIAQQKLE